MAKKTLGYTELQWTCPNCLGINPGLEKVCGQCGAPQPDDIEFKQVKGGELTQDEAVKTRVKVGPDIHCPYCSARNPGDADACSRCGGDLVEGQHRESGKVLGAYRAEPVGNASCPHCGAENPGNARDCDQCGGSMATQEETQPPKPNQDILQRAGAQKKKRIPVGLVIFLVVICIASAIFMFFAMRTEALTGTVAGVSWERSITIEGLIPVDYHDWSDQIPSGGEIQSCQQEVRSVQSEPQPNSEEVCGTPYSVDTGSGFAEVVQDCEYHVYDDYCTYSVIEWASVDTAVLSGTDFYPEWPDPVLSVDQRPGQQVESYLVYFDTDKGEYTYSLSNYDSFQQFQVGSDWSVEVNSFGGVVSVEP